MLALVWIAERFRAKFDAHCPSLPSTIATTSSMANLTNVVSSFLSPLPIGPIVHGDHEHKHGTETASNTIYIHHDDELNDKCCNSNASGIGNNTCTKKIVSKESTGSGASTQLITISSGSESATLPPPATMAACAGSADVLFLCVANSCRSQMADGLFNTLASRRGLPYHAQSAGSRPSITGVNTNAITVMKEIDIDISSHQSKAIDLKQWRSYKQIISLGCADKDLCPLIRVPNDGNGNTSTVIRRDWGLADPVGQPLQVFRDTRDTITHCVDSLLDELQTGVPSKCCC
jgi:arsenate reductase